MVEDHDTSPRSTVSPCPDAYLRMLAEHAGLAVVSADANLRIRFWNGAAARMLGAAAEQMLGAAFLSVIPMDERDEAEQILRKALSNGEIGEFEFRYPGPQGNRRQLAAVISPVVDDEGAVVGVSACVRDITKRILLEEQLAQNRKMVSLGAMAGAIAHHFNNILGGVITSVDFALTSNDPAMQRRVLEKTAHALTRASELGDGLLTFAEGDFRAIDLADLTETLIEVVDAAEADLRSKNIEVEVRVEPIPITAVPAAQFKTVLNNLIHNAAQAMPNGGTLTVELQPIDDGYRIRVIDTGCGVSEALQDRIFEPFYSTRTSGAGDGVDTQAGLGLAVAHGILQVMGGRVTVNSTVGQGSTFEIILPTNPKLPVGRP